MPELPEVETTRLSLLPAMQGRRIAQVVLRRDTLRFPLPAGFAARLEGREIRAIRRRAKYLLFDLDNGESVLAHLGMSGSFTLTTPQQHALRTHDHVLFTLDDGTLAVYHDPRRFGLFDMVNQKDEALHPLLSHLGPEPLSQAFSPSYLAAQLARRKGPVKPALMDQKLVVGVGNIYASESLFLAGVNPTVSACEITGRADAIVQAIRNTLEAALKSGGSTLRDFTHGDAVMGYFQHQFNVYEREGKPCVSCGREVLSIVQAGRSTYYCASCQPLAKKSTTRAKKNHR